VLGDKVGDIQDRNEGIGQEECPAIISQTQ
jgi:hypothetical protein